ncbi:UBA domain-containing protein 3 [Podospora fimiseda]|uniref:UBA domain-containing protein 3 n=1 Tax=Podospora fimiseda TaxID=252190 RepID=A0AAN7BNC1_9PEZI|nr:UBA domain-containing protein 3 [Podospora fimiseda]
MSGALSKRQQARNEKVLHDLVKSVPGNDICADCSARNPSWASWSLGIFLCMRCATIHRKMGTHVSKVKSLSMDSWSNEQVDNMKKVGNVVSNKIYNPENKKANIPIDVDEADSAMERFIRQKYMNRALAATKKHHTGSSEDTPPPLPPKTPSRFGLRSASSIFPLGSKKKSTSGSAPTSPRDEKPSRPQLHNKNSQVFGVSIQRDTKSSDGADETERNLAKLRDMGFTDDSRNAVVMKGVGGNLEKTIEALVRLGEGDGRPANYLAPLRTSSMPITRNLTPGTASSGSDVVRARPISPASTNPFDMLDTPPPIQPLSSQSTGTLQNKNPYLSTNPFGAPQQPQPTAFDLAFQNLSLAPPSQPLFPNHTGGMLQQPHPQTIYQQQPSASMAAPLTAPLPIAGQPGFEAMMMNGGQGYPQQLQPQNTGYNPFLQSQPLQQQQQQQPLAVNTTNPFGGNFGSNPFARSPTRIQSPTMTQIPEQTQQNFYTPILTQQATGTNPFLSAQPQQQQQQPLQMPQQQFPQQMGLSAQMTGYFPPQQQMQQPQQQYQQPQQQYQQPQQQYQQPQQQYQQPQRPDKASILALYNTPSLFQPATTQDPAQVTPAQTPNSLFPPQQQSMNPYGQQQALQPTPVSPGLAPAAVAGSKNPFMMNGGGPQAQAAPVKQHNVSRDSMMAVGLEWTNGRHSPDAFASLSARDMR